MIGIVFLIMELVMDLLNGCLYYQNLLIVDEVNSQYNFSSIKQFNQIFHSNLEQIELQFENFLSIKHIF